ncbi:MAG: DUF2764 family protein [Simkaniaceae bacterium]|nr:DUF2764 family protein [Simkaniaceae bacterium]
MTHFFLAAFLPPLDIRVKVDLTPEELMVILQENLSVSELEQVKQLRTFVDISNLERLYSHDIIDPWGNLSEDELRKEEKLPLFATDLLASCDTEEQKLAICPQIMARFYEQPHQGILKRFFEFEREFRLALTGWRCKKLGIDPLIELKEEDPRDLTVAQIFASKDQPGYEMPFEFEDFGPIPDQPMDQYLKVAEYRFEKVDDLLQGDFNSMDGILGYLIQFMIVKNYHALNDQQGNQLLYDNICNR